MEACGQACSSSMAWGAVSILFTCASSPGLDALAPPCSSLLPIYLKANRSYHFKSCYFFFQIKPQSHVRKHNLVYYVLEKCILSTCL